MSRSEFDPDRLFTQLNKTQVRTKDVVLYQLLFQMIGAIQKIANLQSGVSGGGGGGGGTTLVTNNYTFPQLEANDNAQEPDTYILQSLDMPSIIDAIILGLSNNLSYQIYGRNPDIDTGTIPEDIFNGAGLYPGFPTGAAETVDVSSSSINDVNTTGTGAWTVHIYGLSSTYALQDEVLNLNGITKVTSANTYRRVFRSIVETVGSGGTNAGTITVQHTTTTADVFNVIAIGFGQSSDAVFTIPLDYVGYIIEADITMNDNSTNRGYGAIYIRELNNSVRLINTFGISTDYETALNMPTPVGPFPYGTDITFRVLNVVNNNADVSMDYHILLIKT